MIISKTSIFYISLENYKNTICPAVYNKEFIAFLGKYYLLGFLSFHLAWTKDKIFIS